MTSHKMIITSPSRDAEIYLLPEAFLGLVKVAKMREGTDLSVHSHVRKIGFFWLRMS